MPPLVANENLVTTFEIVWTGRPPALDPDLFLLIADLVSEIPSVLFVSSGLLPFNIVMLAWLSLGKGFPMTDLDLPLDALSLVKGFSPLF
jgi:hypothetical protein